MSRPSSLWKSYALPPICDRLSISSTRSPRCEAMRSASTLPAKPPPTTSQSNTLHLENCRLACGWKDFALLRLAHESGHVLPCPIPGHLGKVLVDLLLPRGLRAAEQGHRALDKGCRIVCDLHQSHLAIGPNDVGDGSGNHPDTGREKFRGLGWADETRGLVDREGHQPNVPTRKKLRQVVVRLSSQPMDVRPLGKCGRIDFSHRPQHD